MEYELYESRNAGQFIGEVFDSTTNKSIVFTLPGPRDAVISLCETLCVALNCRGYCKTPLGWDSV